MSASEATTLPFGMDSRDESKAYFRWQAESFGPYGDGLVVDHGAGTGALTHAMVEAGARKLVAIEPDDQLFRVLSARFAGSPVVETFHGTLTDWRTSPSFQAPAVIGSSNVLEHIKDDRACLREMYEALVPGGRLGLYLPARQELYGSLDDAVGHYRRYGRTELRTKVQEAGFRLLVCQYRNAAGILPWLWTGRIARKSSIGGGSVRLYDQVIFPVTRWVEDRVPLPYGLNLLLIAEKA